MRNDNSARNYRRRLFAFILPIVVLLKMPQPAYAGSKNASLEVRAGSKIESDGRFDYVDILRGAKLVKRIPCQSSSESSKSCFPTRISTGGFVVVDCIHHDAVLENCVLRKYSYDGELDETFKTSFGRTLKDIALDKIGGVELVEESKTKPGFLEVTGHFIYKGLDEIPSCLKNFCIEEENCAGFDGYYSEAKLTFDPKGNVSAMKVLRKATIPHSKKQIEQELAKAISAEKARKCVEELK